MASLLPKARLLGLCFPLLLVACGESTSSLPSDPPIDSPENLPLPSARAFSLERENQGAYMEGTVEQFHAVSARSDVKSVLWSASGGKLETQGLQATWTLPRAGTASLTLTAETQSGEQLTETFQFRVSAEASTQADGSLANVPLAPVSVDTSNDTTGDACDLAFDTAGNGHLIYFNATHPSLWYGSWNGTTWTTQMVDGMGFNTGGVVLTTMALTVDAAGKPHIVYALSDKGIWYATLSGTTWTRERVDTAALAPDYGYRVSIALDPSQGNRPTIAYTWYDYVTNVGYRYRTIVSYRTGANTWTTAMPPFPAPSQNTDLQLSGEILFDPAGTLYLPLGQYGFGSWKAAAAPGYSEFPSSIFVFGNDQASLVRTPAGHLLVRSAGQLLDITPGTTAPVASFLLSNIDAVSSSVGDLIYAGGKPQEIHLHGGSLELTVPNANNYWTYTSLGTATANDHIALAQRPTTGTIHYCFQSGSKVMFQ